MRSKQYVKKLLSLIIASVMIVTMLPVSALAAGTDDVMIEDQAETIVEEATGDEVVEEAAEVPDADDTYDAAVTENIADVIEEDDVDDADAAEDELSDAVDGFKKGFDNTLVGAVGDAPKPKKRLHDNGDGTHTLSLSVTGSSSTSTSTQVDKANVILVLDVSSSMNYATTGNNYYLVSSGFVPPASSAQSVSPHYYAYYNGNYVQARYYNGRWQRQTNGNSYTDYNGNIYSPDRFWAMKHALTDSNGVIDELLAQNVSGDANKQDVIEVSIISFGAHVNSNAFSYNANILKNQINSLQTESGTNWEGALVAAKEQADAIKQSQPDEKVYVIFLTDGQPTQHGDGSMPKNSNTAEEWGYAKDDARAIVTNNYVFYGLFTWGDANEATYLKSLVQYAYTGEGSYNTDLDSQYADYYEHAQSTSALISKLQQIVHNITENVGYTDVEITDGVTEMTSSSVSASTSGTISGVKYYRGGGENNKYGAVDVDNGIYGTVWTDAPAATINNDGEIDWHLGTNFVLEDGVTYTITFTVWPKQEAMNLVADLNNRVRTYDSLSDEEKAQIHQSGSSYSLKTNTDYPTVSYRTITTTQEEGQEPVTTTSERMTSNITNPEPVGLSQSSMHAKKIWEDSLDESQRAEFAGTVTLYLMKDNDYYYRDPVTHERMGVTLTADSEWTETNYIYIAPGILVDENSPAYDSTKPQVEWQGKTYAILERGHEYIFEESVDNHHYELINYIHHPMVMGSDGHGNPVVKDVTFTKDGSGNITGIESVVGLEDHLSATNALKGGINISKKVVDVNDSEKELDVSDPFKMTVHITDAEGNKLPDKTIKVDGADVTFNYDYRIYYGKNNPLYATSGSEHRSDHIYGTGTSFEVQNVYVGDVIRVVNIETGALFYVEENLDSNSDYDLVGVDYKIGEGTSDPSAAVAYSADEKVNKNNQTWYPVKRNSASHVTVTNQCAPFYVYHSGVAGDGNLETVAVPKNNRTYDLTQNLTPNTLYGGYYLNYAGKGTYADNGVKGENGEVYTGMNRDWSAKATGDQVQTVSGKAMKPTPRETYYIKEVPVYYLLNYYQLNYMKTDEQKLMSMYLISAIDDLNYRETGFTITQGNEKAKVASSVTFQNAATNKKVTLRANTVFKAKGIDGKGSDKDKLTYYDLTPNTTFFKADSSFSVKPYWITPDGITVHGVSTREIKIETLTRKGVTKIDK